MIEPVEQTIRCFLGMGLLDADRARIQSCLLPLRGQPWANSVRWVAAHNWHLTLMFLGNRSSPWLAAVRADLAALSLPSAATESVMTASGLQVGCFPDAKGRIVALELQPDPSLLAIKSRLDSLLQRHGCEPETRSFRPHVTLGRFERGGHEPVLPVSFTSTLTFSRLTLFQSTPTRQGSEYQALWSLPLDGLFGVDDSGQSTT